jgi:hypothetical protein
MYLCGPVIAGVAPCLLKREHRDVGNCEEEYAFRLEVVRPPARPDLASAQERCGPRTSIGSVSDRPDDR